jgi:hypothetical protein
VGIETPDGPAVLAHVTGTAPGNDTSFHQMMHYITYYMRQRGLSLVKKPLKLDNAELQRVMLQAGPISRSWMSKAVIMALCLPLLILLLFWVTTVFVGPIFGDLAPWMAMACVILGTLLFIYGYQYQMLKWIRANNRLSYFHASRGYDIYDNLG